MPVRTHLARIAVSVVFAATGAAGLDASAEAATYDVVSCTSNSPIWAPISGVDDAWTTETNDETHLQLIPHCPRTLGSELDGMLVQSMLNSSSAPLGSFAEWRFDAPTGTSLTRLRLWREIGKLENSWELYTRAANGVRLGGTAGTSPNDSDCLVDPDEFGCQVGFPGDAAADWTPLNTTGVRVGLRCAAASCLTGATLHEAWTAIYGATVTVDDPTPPAASSAGGNLLTDTYVHGNATATLTSATDTTGIRAVQVKEGGTLLAQTQRTCDYSRRVPCTNLAAPGSSVTVVTTGMTDGEHTVQVGATDAAGNFGQATSQQITVDNHAPVAPTPTSPTQQTVTTPAATVAWQAPGGQVAPVTAAHVTVCGPRTCQPTTPATGPDDGSATVSLTDGYGLYSVLVSLEDAAGNVDSNEIAMWQVNYPDPNPARPPQPPTTTPNPTTPAPLPVPQPTPTPQPAPARTSARLTAARPTVARDHRTIAVKGTVAPGTTGKVTIKATAKIRGRTRAVTKRATIRNRRYAAHIKLPSTTWRTATITVTFGGDARHRSARLTRRLAQRAS